MELPIKFPIPSGCWPETFYTIETKNLYYKISTHFDDVNLACFGGSSRRSPNFILKDVNFEARPGDITAIAGPSGAGKTTLLEILAGRISPKKVCGQVLVNSKAMDTSFFRKISGYVTQVDALFPLLTVEETLMYSARLRLRGAHKESATTKVRQLLKELGLEHVASSRIGEGSMINSISGGERRRVSIGVDLVHDPDVILIDEPTSGLDSISALHLISLLKSMVVYQGKTIVLTIHQPGYRILEQFDHIVLLSNGNVAHHGTLSLLEQNLKMFGHCIPKHVNVLEFAIDVVDTLILQNKYVENKMRLALSNNLDEKFISYPNSRLNEIVVLGERFYNNISRSKQLFATRVIQAIVAGFVLGTIFLNVGGDEGKNALQTQTGFFAFSLTFLLSTTTEGLPIFLQERRILVSEIERGAYRISSYVIANTIVFLPFLLMVCLLYTTPVYWLVGLRKDIDRFLYFCLIVWMVLLMSNSFVACFSALVPNFIMGTSVIAGLMGSFFLFSGYFIAKKSIPSYWIFMHYLSLFKYPFECFLINEYAQGDQGTRRCVKIEEKHCILYGDEFLEQQGLKGSQKWTNLIVMLGFIIGYRVLCFLILWCKCYNRTRK